MRRGLVGSGKLAEKEQNELECECRLKHSKEHSDHPCLDGGEKLTKTLFITPRQKQLLPPFDDKFWGVVNFF